MNGYEITAIMIGTGLLIYAVEQAISNAVQAGAALRRSNRDEQLQKILMIKMLNEQMKHDGPKESEFSTEDVAYLEFIKKVRQGKDTESDFDNAVEKGEPKVEDIHMRGFVDCGPVVPGAL